MYMYIRSEVHYNQMKGCFSHEKRNFKGLCQLGARENDFNSLNVHGSHGEIGPVIKVG